MPDLPLPTSIGRFCSLPPREPSADISLIGECKSVSVTCFDMWDTYDISDRPERNGKPLNEWLQEHLDRGLAHYVHGWDGHRWCFLYLAAFDREKYEAWKGRKSV